jgi:hypothetical protein
MKNNNRLYKWLIVTFIILYSATAFVSFYHSITFFNIANAVWLSIILSLVAEIGQASVLFSLLLTKNKNNWLAWSIMFLLTGLQIVGNVVSSFKYISVTNSIDFTYFQKSILFWVANTNTEMFKIIIAWITGGILPIIALSMTALVADNLKLKDEEPQSIQSTSDEPIPEHIHLDKNLQDGVEPAIDELPDAKNSLKQVIEDLVEEIKHERESEAGVVPEVVPEVVVPVVSKKPSKPRASRAKKQKPKTEIKGKNINLKPVRDLDSIKKLSRGSELIQTMQSDAHKNDIETPITPTIIDQSASNTQTVPNEAPPNSDNVLSTTYDASGNVIDKNFK